ncbi:Rho guanine nucleotide exchange factor 17 [Trichuris trichiura]|uniref:Rho guanine nucleotide exchange factor 17 n=1 Tax=Trichuris trichiura TaxID=36087 RepID=A0A077ZDG3_TRITR|nr:Rho guanine nucleotide exchange factor 17 [Trichuris trichiura]
MDVTSSGKMSSRRRRRERHSRSFTLSPSAESRYYFTNECSRPKFAVGSSNSSQEWLYRRKTLSPLNKRGVHIKPSLPSFVSNGRRLRKTYSEPTEINDDDDVFVERYRSEESPGLFYPTLRGPSASRISSPGQSASSSFSPSSNSPPVAMHPSSEDIVWSTPRGSFANDGHKAEDEPEPSLLTVYPDGYRDTQIRELQGAAQSIEALSRRNRRRLSDFTAGMRITDGNGPQMDSTALRRRSGITTRLGGQPRGIIQFLPSVKRSDMSRSLHQSYIADKIRRERLYSDHSDPERSKAVKRDPFCEGEKTGFVEPVEPRSYAAYRKMDAADFVKMAPEREVHQRSRSAQRRMTNAVDRDNLQAYHHHRMDLESLRNLDALDSVNRFTSLLKSLRSSDGRTSDQADEINGFNSQEDDAHLSSPDVSESSTTSAEFSQHNNLRQSELISDSDSFLQADMLLWRRRSKGSIRKHQDTRTHIVKELVETENSYVENLKLLVHKYLRPLKRPELCSLVELGTLNEIFFQVPEMLAYHEAFLKALKSRIDLWDNKQKIGDILLANFTKQCVIDTYMAFINNWKNARLAIRKACSAKPAFAKYLERCSREHMNKLSLDALLIMPVQRIPRYELLLKELLKHTSVEHPDHALLLRAGKVLHELANKIDQTQQETGFSDQMQQKLREIEAIVEGLDDLVSPERIYYRCDLVQVDVSILCSGLVFLMFMQIFQTANGIRDRCLFLFSDLLLITTVTAKAGAALTKATQNATPGITRNFFETRKFKLLLKLSLQDLCVVDNNKQLIMKVKEEIANLQEDLRVAGKLAELTMLLKVDHRTVSKEVENLVDFIKVTLGSRHEELIKDRSLTSLNLLVTTEFGNEPLLVTFKSTDNRLTWERNFEEAKCAFAVSQSQRQPPVFVKFIAANRTRSGFHVSKHESTNHVWFLMERFQFTCATSSWSMNGICDVWMCSSDQMSGQVFLLSLHPEVDVLNVNFLCNSRISCLCYISPRKLGPRKPKVTYESSKENKQQIVCPKGCLSLCQHVLVSSIELDSDSSCGESSAESTSASETIRINGSIPDGIQETAILDPNDRLFHCTTWVGTENGAIQIYDRDDCNHPGRCKLETQLGTPIRCMTYYDEKIFIALGNGTIGFYECNEDNKGTLGDLRMLQIEHKFPPVSAMTVATNKLWCGTRNHLLVINLNSLKIEVKKNPKPNIGNIRTLQCLFAVNNDRESYVACLAANALAVWLSMYNSAVVKLYHAGKFECLMEISISPTVTKTLAGCDDIIRQHKLACLRITTMMCCKDMLWIGTSAGVLCYLSTPQVAHQTSKISATPNLFSTRIGHMGPCRFLVSIDVPDHTVDDYTSGKRSKSNDLSRRRMSLNVANLHQRNVYVISGGEGLEDYQEGTNDENDDSFGMEDSTNYLIIWKV